MSVVGKGIESVSSLGPSPLSISAIPPSLKISDLGIPGYFSGRVNSTFSVFSDKFGVREGVSERRFCILYAHLLLITYMEFRMANSNSQFLYD